MTSLHSVRQHMMLICPIADDVNANHLIEVVSARILRCEVTSYPLAMNEYFVGSYFETVTCPVPAQIFN